jgi:hypothetical protein
VGIVSIPHYFSQIGAPNPLEFDEQYVRQEMKSLAMELKEVEAEIAALKAMIHGLSVIYGAGIADKAVLRLVRPEPRTNKRGLTPACQTVLRRAERPCSVSEICAQVNALNPDLLLTHSKPMASVMSVLRSMERRGQVVRGHEGGRSVWRLADLACVQ